MEENDKTEEPEDVVAVPQTPSFQSASHDWVMWSLGHKAFGSRITLTGSPAGALFKPFSSSDLSLICEAENASTLPYGTRVKAILRIINALKYRKLNDYRKHPEMIKRERKLRAKEAAWRGLKDLVVKEIESNQHISKGNLAADEPKLKKLAALLAALEDTKSLFVSGISRGRGKHGEVTVPTSEVFCIFFLLRREYLALGGVAPKDSVLQGIIQKCLGEANVLVTRDAVRKAVQRVSGNHEAEKEALFFTQTRVLLTMKSVAESLTLGKK